MVFVILLVLRCRGSLGAIVITGILDIVVLLLFVTNRQKTIINIIIWFVSPLGLFILIGIITGTLKSVTSQIFSSGVDLNGRDTLTKVAWDNFLRNIFTGTGFGSQRNVLEGLPEMYLNGHSLYNYHNIYNQTLSTTGVFGGFAFVNFFLSVFKTFKKSDAYSLVVGIFCIYLFLHGIVDTTFYTYRVMLVIAIAFPFLKW
jgi:O-antigen ligase